jgi:hypothetical protein
MSKLLNTRGKSSPVGVASPVALRSSTYEPSIPRVALGIAGAAMAVLTIAVSVVLPAQVDSGSRAGRMLAVSKATTAPPMALASVARIDVVVRRETESISVPVRIGDAPWQPAQSVTTSPAVIRVSSTDR